MAETEDKKTEESKKTDPNADGKADTGATSETEKKGKTFTQEELDQIINERLKRERETVAKANADAEAKRKEEERISKLQGEEKLRAEYDLKQKEVEAKLSAVTRSLRVAEAESELSKVGISTDFVDAVIGKDVEETRSKVASLRKLIDAEVTKKVNAGVGSGKIQNPNGAGKGEDSDQLTLMRKAAGLI